MPVLCEVFAVSNLRSPEPRPPWAKRPGKLDRLNPATRPSHSLVLVPFFLLSYCSFVSTPTSRRLDSFNECLPAGLPFLWFTISSFLYSCSNYSHSLLRVPNRSSLLFVDLRFLLVSNWIQ